MHLFLLMQFLFFLHSSCDGSYGRNRESLRGGGKIPWVSHMSGPRQQSQWVIRREVCTRRSENRGVVVEGDSSHAHAYTVQELYLKYVSLRCVFIINKFCGMLVPRADLKSRQFRLSLDSHLQYSTVTHALIVDIFLYSSLVGAFLLCSSAVLRRSWMKSPSQLVSIWRKCVSWVKLCPGYWISRLTG